MGMNAFARRIYDPKSAFITPTASLFPIQWRKAAASTALAVALVALPVQSAPAVLPPEVSLQSERQFVEEAWKIVNDFYLDELFNRVDWQSQLQQLLQSPMQDRAATYKQLKKAVATLNDRYTRVLVPQEMEQLGKFDVSGVGLLLTKDDTGRLVVATEPAKNTAASQAGIKRGDQVLAVDGREIRDANPFDVAQWMQGPDGTTMQIQFRDSGDTMLMRKYRSQDAPLAVTRVAAIDRPDGRMGYIRLAEFRASGRTEVANALEVLRNEGVQWIVVDLRGNHGGVFEGALEIAGLFEGEGEVVARVSSRSSVQGGMQTAYKSTIVKGEHQIDENIDLAILIDDESASSSEVLAGGLRDSCRAALVGERSYGKGLIQGVFGLSDGGGVVVTVAEYHTPRGDSINGIGLTPDVSFKYEGVDRLLRFLGITRVSEKSTFVSREQVREITQFCKAQKSSQEIT